MPSPGGASAILKRDSTSPMTQLNAAGESLNSRITRFALSLGSICHFCALRASLNAGSDDDD